MAPILLSFADLRGKASSTMKFVISILLLLLLLPFLLLSLLLMAYVVELSYIVFFVADRRSFSILLSPAFIVLLIYLAELEDMFISTLGPALKSVADDLVPLSRLETSVRTSEPYVPNCCGWQHS